MVLRYTKDKLFFRDGLAVAGFDIFIREYVTHLGLPVLPHVAYAANA